MRDPTEELELTENESKQLKKEAEYYGVLDAIFPPPLWLFSGNTKMENSSEGIWQNYTGDTAFKQKTGIYSWICEFRPLTRSNFEIGVIKRKNAKLLELSGYGDSAWTFCAKGRKFSRSTYLQPYGQDWREGGKITVILDTDQGTWANSPS